MGVSDAEQGTCDLNWQIQRHARIQIADIQIAADPTGWDDRAVI